MCKRRLFHGTWSAFSYLQNFAHPTWRLLSLLGFHDSWILKYFGLNKVLNLFSTSQTFTMLYSFLCIKPFFSRFFASLETASHAPGLLYSSIFTTSLSTVVEFGSFCTVPNNPNDEFISQRWSRLLSSPTISFEKCLKFFGRCRYNLLLSIDASQLQYLLSDVKTFPSMFVTTKNSVYFGTGFSRKKAPRRHLYSKKHPRPVR